jgi:hypothetical protein
MRNGCLAWNCILVLGRLSTLIGRAAAQDTSTPEERALWVEVTHKLESAPLDNSVNKQREAAFKRLSDVHDVHVLLCPALLTEFNGMKYTYSHAITRQYMLASGAFHVAIRVLQQVYAATHPTAFIEKDNAPQPQRTTDPAITDLLTALDRDAAEDREE